MKTKRISLLIPAGQLLKEKKTGIYGMRDDLYYALKDEKEECSLERISQLTGYKQSVCEYVLDQMVDSGSTIIKRFKNKTYKAGKKRRIK